MSGRMKTSTAMLIGGVIMSVLAIVMLVGAVRGGYVQRRFQSEGTLISAIVTEKRTSVTESINNDEGDQRNWYVSYRPETRADGPDIREEVTRQTFEKVREGETIHVWELDDEYWWPDNQWLNPYAVVAGVSVIAGTLLFFGTRSHRRSG